MSAVFFNIAIGLATSVLSGGFVWAWQRGRNIRILRRKQEFFGLQSGAPCLIVMNHKYDTPGSTAQNDVQAMIKVATFASEIGSKISVRSCDEVKGINADHTEFCIGGINSNPRTLEYLANYFPGVTLKPYSAARRDSTAIVVGNQRFLLEHGKAEYALVAKFTPPASTRPVMIICGQKSIANRGAIEFLHRNYLTLMKSLTSTDQFCLMVKIVSSDIYGHEMTELAGDVTIAAFTDPRIRSQGHEVA